MTQQEIRFKFAVDGAQAAVTSFDTVGQAAQRVGTVLSNQASLGTAARGLDVLGVSARQTAAAMRLLPAQITDVFTQLAGGANPLLVLIQQGGQVKDSFGGLGNTFRALGSAISPLAAVLGTSAAALGGVVAAVIAGDSELRKLRNTLQITGNAAGLTVDGFNNLARAVQGSANTSIGRARDTLLELAGSGRLSGDALRQTAIAAERLSMATGEGSDAIGKRFAGMLDSVATSAAQLNKQYNFLTLAQFKQIRALEEQGRVQEAMAKAMAALNERLGDQTRNLGFLERSWHAVKVSVSEAWEALKAIGRDNTPRELIEKLNREINVILTASNFREPAQGTASSLRIAALRAQLVEVRKLAQAEEQAATASAKARQTDSRAIAKLLADTKDTGSAYRSLLGDIDKLILASTEELDSGEKLSAARRLQIDLFDKLADAADKLSLKQRLEIKGRIDTAVALRAEAEARERTRQRMLQGARDIIEVQEEGKRQAAEVAEVEARRAQALASQLQQLDERIQGLRDESAAVRLAAERNISLAEAIELVVAARLVEQRVKFVNDPIGLFTLDQEIVKRREIARLIGSNEVQQANLRAAQDAARAWEQAAQQISQTLTDALLNGGRDGAQQIKALFRQLVLRPVVQMGVDTVLASLGVRTTLGNAQGLAGGLQGLAGFGNLLGGASGLGNILGGASGLWGSSAAYGAALGTTSIGAGSQAAMLAAQTGVFGAEGIAATASAAGGAAGGLMSGLAAVAPYLAVAYAIYSIAKSMDNSGTPHFGGYAAFDAAGKLVPSYGAGEPNRSADYDRMVGDLIRPIGGALNNLVDAFGLGGKFGVAGTFKAQGDGADGAWGVVQIDRAGGQTIFRRADGTLAGDPTKGFEDYTKLLGQSVREAVDALDLPGWADGVLADLDQTASTEQILAAVDRITQTGLALDALSDTFATMGGLFERIAGGSQDVQKQLADVFGGVSTLAQQAASFYETFYSDAEKAARGQRIVADALAAVNLAVPTTRDEFRALVDAQDASTESGRQAIHTLLGVAGTFAELHPAAEQLVADNQRLLDIARERSGLETELLRLQGDTVALRERELLALDPANRALQEQIYALQDAATLQAAAAQRLQDDAAVAARALDEIANAANRVAAAKANVTTTLQALRDFGDGLRAQIEQTVQGIAEIRSRALDQVAASRDRLAAVIATIGQAVEQAAQRIAAAESAMRVAREARAGAATSIAGLLGQQQQSVFDARSSVASALAALRGEADNAGAAELALRGRITDDFLRAQSAYQTSLERLAGLQERAGDSAAAVAQRMQSLSASVGDYLRELTGSTAGLTRQPAVNRAIFEAMAQRARGGDAQAAGDLVSSAKAFLDASREGSASGAAYDADVRLVRRVLAEVGATAATLGAAAQVDDGTAAIARAQADVASALAEMQRLRGIADVAGASLVANSVDLLGEWRLAQSAAIQAQQAYLRAADLATAAGVSEAPAVDAFAQALAGLTSAQDAMASLLQRVAAAGIDLQLADTRDSLQQLIDGYVSAETSLVAASQEWRDALVENARATDLFRSAQQIAADAGVVLAASSQGLASLFGDLGLASRDLANAQRVAAEVGAVQPTVTDLAEEFSSLTGRAVTLIEQLGEFERRVAAVDFSGLQVLDPLGDLLLRYAEAANELVAATVAQQQSGLTETWADIGGGVWRYVSGGGAVAVQRAGEEPTLFGRDGRVRSLGAVQEYVRQLFAAGDLATLYQEAVSFGISSADLERITGTGSAVLAWARAAGLPAFAAGADYVARTGMALVHEGERVLPAADNARLVEAMSSYHDMSAELRALRDEVRRLREEQLAGHVSIAEHTRAAARTLKRWDGDGAPVRNAEGTTLEVV